jgi:ADP-heptose:LPS heptosyltransferase
VNATDVRRVCMFFRFPGAGVGDLVQRNIFLKLMRDAYPRASLTWFVDEEVVRSPFLSDLVDRHSYATDVVACPAPTDVLGRDRPWQEFLRGLPGHGFDACVVDPRSFLLGPAEAAAAGIPIRIAVPTGEASDSLITDPLRLTWEGTPDPDLYDYARALAGALRIDLPAQRDRIVPRLPLQPVPLPDWAAHRPIVGMHPACSPGWNRRWPLPAFAELAVRIVGATDAELVLLGGRGDAAEIDHIRAAVRRHHTRRPVRTWLDRPLVEVASLIDGLDLLVGNDSGPAHLAAALGTPTVVMYGPDGEEAMWRRVYPHHHGLNLHYPCQDRDNEEPRFEGQCELGCPCDYVAPEGPYPKCLSDIPVDAVWAAVAARLGIAGTPVTADRAGRVR